MRLLNVAPTKSTLLRLREHFGFVTAGHKLLDQKREVLLDELVQVFREARQFRRRLQRDFAALYAPVRAALLVAGRSAVEREAVAAAGTQALAMRERSVMGVIVPLLELEASDAPQPVTAPGDGPGGPAAARRWVRDLLPALIHLAELEVSCRRLAAELQKTQRRVNALEHVFIPQYRDTIRFIEASLEEKEREALFQLKRLKARRKPLSAANGGVP
jgi:V/A-type H+-transporting ATPase subunit D